MTGDYALQQYLDTLSAKGISVFLIYNPFDATYTIRALKGEKSVTEITDRWISTMSDSNWNLIERIKKLVKQLEGEN